MQKMTIAFFKFEAVTENRYDLHQGSHHAPAAEPRELMEVQHTLCKYVNNI